MLVLCKLKCCHYQGVSLLSTDERGEHWSRLVRWIEEVFHVDIHLLSKHFSNWGHDTDHRVGNVTRSILPPCPINDIGVSSRKKFCDGQANKEKNTTKDLFYRDSCFAISPNLQHESHRTWWKSLVWRYLLYTDNQLYVTSFICLLVFMQTSQIPCFLPMNWVGRVGCEKK